MKDVNWEEIQNFYNDNHTWDDIVKFYNISHHFLMESIKNGLIKLRNKSEAGKLSHKNNPRILSKETKEKISISRKKYLSEHPDQVPYLLNHYSKGESYPEKYFETILNKTNLKYERYLQISLYNLDFAFTDKGIDLEIDGNQHYDDKRIVESNKNRDLFLESKGWKVIRIRWSYYMSLDKNEKKNYIYELIKFLKNEINEIPLLTTNKKYCMCGKEIDNRCFSCRSCSKLKQPRKVENRPSLDVLLEELSESNYVNLGKKYKVSDNTIRKWIKSYGGIPPKSISNRGRVDRSLTLNQRE